MDFTPAFRLYARWRRDALARQNAVAEQERQLLRLIAKAKDTRFGKDHGFTAVRSVADFQRAVPLRRYEDFRRDYWQGDFPLLENVSWPGRIPYFAVTSGTTSDTSKFIPVSHAMNRANARAALDIVVHHLAHRPQSRILGGKSFMLGGATELKTLVPGVLSGDLSGIALAHAPAWIRFFAFPPPEIAREKDWEKKIDAIAKAAPGANIRNIGGTPPWLLLLFERQAKVTGGKTAPELYPALEMLVHGGVNFTPYRARFEAFLADRAELREVYPASEGFIAIQDETPADGLRLLADNGLFFEFVPVEELDSNNPTRHTLANARTGVNYALVLSSCAGAFAYVIGDTVRFVGLDPPRILVTGRTSYFMSAFGEHLIGEEIEAAVADAAAAIGRTIQDFAMGALYPHKESEKGRHLYVVEFSAHPAAEEKTRFLESIDSQLCARNDDYRDYRMADKLAAPEVLAVPAGTFAQWMKKRGKMGGQNKVPRVINDADLFADLCAFAGNERP